MPLEIDTASLDKAIELYLAGKPMQEIESTTGVFARRVHKERTKRGVPPRRNKVLPIDAIVAAYLGGASEYALGRQYGVSRDVIRKRLQENGTPRRGRSEAGLNRTAKMTSAERKAQAAAANRVARTIQHSQVDKLRRALATEQRGVHDSAGEQWLAELLRERGLDPIPQRAIGVNNVDLAMLPVAVEVLGGGFHSAKGVHVHRTPYILDEGWSLVMVWDFEGRSALGPGAADYIVAFTEEVRRNPPATSQYRVIAGNGELLAACGREDDEFTLVPPPRGRF